MDAAYKSAIFKRQSMVGTKPEPEFPTMADPRTDHKARASRMISMVSSIIWSASDAHRAGGRQVL
jgi:hypothetical protein